MSSPNNIKALIGPKQLFVYRTEEGKDLEGIREKIFECKLEKDSFSQNLLDFKKKFQVDRVSLLFTDDTALTNLILAEKELVDSREAVETLIKNKLSIDLSRTIWDYTKIDNLVQIVRLPADYAEYIAPAFSQAGIQVESIEPVSVSLAKSLSSRSEPTVLVYDDVERLVTICYQGMVFEPTLFIPVELSNKSKKIKQNFNKIFSKEVKQAIVSAGFADPYIADLTALSLNTEVKRLDPFTGVMIATPGETNKDTDEKAAVNNKSGDVSDRMDKEIPSEINSAADLEKPEDFKDVWQESAKEEKEPLPTEIKEETKIVIEKEVIPDIQVNRETIIKPKRNLTWLIMVIPLLLTLIIVGYLLLNRQSETQLINPLIEATVGGNSTATGSGSLTDKAKLKIQVLNGSGKTGEAAKAKSLLEKAGFTVEAVGNATTSSAIKTEIKSTKVLSEPLTKDFRDSLVDLYDTQFTTGAITDFDIIVTVGKGK